MSNYTKSTNFAAKDSLPSGNANKVVKGTELNTEFDNIATAITSKADLNSPTLVTPNLGTPSVAVLTNATGLPLTAGAGVTGTLPVANGGTGASTFSSGALLKGAGTSAITTATAGTDYAPATSGTSILKGNGTGGFSNAAVGTDYAAATTGTSAQLLANNGSGGFSNVTVGSGLSLSAGTLSTSGGASISAGDSNVTVSDTGSNGTVTVQTDGSERMRITSAGNLLVGTTSTSLASASSGTGLQYIPNNAVIVAANGGNSCLITNKTDSTTGSTAIFRYNGNTVGDISITSTNTAYNTASSSANGAQLNYQGITFPATQSASSDANTLDDYEEGTWTPNQGAGLTVVGAFSSSGVYTKVGRIVTVHFSVLGATSVAVNAGGLVTSNLPFAFNTSYTQYGTGGNGGSQTQLGCTLGGSTTVYALQASAATGSISYTITYTT